MANEEWRSPAFRQSILRKIEEHIQQYQSPLPKSANDFESQVFNRAKTKEDYLACITKIFMYIKSNSKKPMVGGMVSGVNNTNVIQKTLGQNQQNINQQMGVGSNVASNLLQNLNQRPGQQMNMQQAMHNKMPGMNMLPNQQMSMNQMGQMQNIQNNSMMNQMNQMNQGNMGQQIGPQPGQQQIGGPQMNTSQMQQAMQNQMQNQMGGHQLGGPMNPGMQSPIQPQQSPSQPQQHLNQMNSVQMNVNQMSQQQLGHMQRKPVEMMNAGYPGQRNITPNQFLSQSPSSSAPSPGGLGALGGNQMIPSPALVPSPSNSQHTMLGGQRSLAMAPSPSSSLNTPAGIIGGAVSSPLQDDQMSQACKEKIQKLRKYIEPLNKWILKMTNEGYIEKTRKMKKLLEILINPSSVTTLDVLEKCENVLEKMEFNKLAAGPVISTNLKEHQFLTPLLEVVNTVLTQNPIPNHTLHRTFTPCVDALFGPEIKNLPPPLKKQKTEEAPCEIPDVLQGEIARLDQRFKISLDPTQQTGSKCIQLICWLDDKHLPCVPPVSITVPSDYPTVPPKCVLAGHEYTTSYLNAVQKALNARLAKFPKRFSISQVLDAWETSVRQACAPKVQQNEKSAALKTTTTMYSTMQTTTVTSNNSVNNGIPTNFISTAAS